MSEENGGKDPMSVPPSFIPSAGRKKTEPQPHKSPVPPKSGSQSIPSFSPASQQARSSASHSARRSTQSASAAPSAAASGTPQSFRPAARSASGTRKPATSSPASFAPVSASHNPKRTVQQVRGSSSRPASTPRMTNQGTSRQNMAGSGASALQSVAKKSVRPHGKRHVGRTILIIFLAIILSLGLSTFSAWNWVDGQLNKQSWLTGKADTAGESWLILGSDEREGTIGDAGDVTGFRTDTILVLTKPKSGSSSLISIPRDSLVEIDQNYMKINAVAQLYSGKQLVNEVEDITGQKIDHVTMVQFGGLVKVVDALGGVELCYDQDVDDPYSQLHWTAGCHTADGNTALAFSRMRYADAQGDFGRAARQRQVINAIVKKGASKNTLLNFGKVKKVAEAALSSVTVDEKASTSSLLHMALAFKSASGDQGISGSVYWTDPDYYVDGVGSSVLLDEQKNLEMFSELAKGTHEAGTVGTLAEQQG
ncbi:LCP family protein [Bifidobacterium sp.]|uniref:LCP family protein n=1 Tax=Bifidobacterium sp. TaxID=41200 RepID=UPI0040265EAA